VTQPNIWLLIYHDPKKNVRVVLCDVEIRGLFFFQQELLADLLGRVKVWMQGMVQKHNMSMTDFNSFLKFVFFEVAHRYNISQITYLLYIRKLHENLSYSMSSLSSFFILSLKRKRQKESKSSTSTPTSPTSADSDSARYSSVVAINYLRLSFRSFPWSRVTGTCSPHLAQSRHQWWKVHANLCIKWFPHI